MLRLNRQYSTERNGEKGHRSNDRWKKVPTTNFLKKKDRSNYETYMRVYKLLINIVY